MHLSDLHNTNKHNAATAPGTETGEKGDRLTRQAGPSRGPDQGGGFFDHLPTRTLPPTELPGLPLLDGTPFFTAWEREGVRAPPRGSTTVCDAESHCGTPYH